jgi:hypothetical protein
LNSRGIGWVFLTPGCHRCRLAWLVLAHLVAVPQAVRHALGQVIGFFRQRRIRQCARGLPEQPKPALKQLDAETRQRRMLGYRRTPEPGRAAQSSADDQKSTIVGRCASQFFTCWSKIGPSTSSRRTAA